MKPSLGLVNAVLTLSGALASIAVAASAQGVPIAGFPRATVFYGFAGTTAVGALLGVILCVRAGSLGKTHLLGALSIAAAVCGALGSIVASAATDQYGHGRPFRRRGANRTAPTEAGDRWLEDVAEDVADDGGALLPSVPAELREGLAAEWRRSGAKEHASIAAFSRLSLELLALGAPPELLAEAQSDALDEIRHAQLCFSIARELDGRAEGPASFPEARESPYRLPSRTLALGKLAIDAIIDGALNEGVSARILGRLSRTSTPPRLVEALRGMAADEARHASHSWNIVAFCIEAGGPCVIHALRGALRGLPETMTAPLPEAARGGAWEAFGVQGEALEREAWASTRRHAVAKLTAMLDGRDTLLACHAA